MKQNFKKYLKLGILLFGISIFLVNCQIDDSINNEYAKTNKSQYKITVKSFKEFSNEKKFENTLQKLNSLTTAIKYRGFENKESENEEIFTIDSTIIKQLEKDGYISHTFFMKRDSVSSDYFENLVVKTDSTGQTETYIIKYIPSEEDYDIENFAGVKETKIITEDPTSGKIYSVTVCVTITTVYAHWLCDNAATQTNCDFQGYTYSSETSCDTTFFDTGVGGGADSGDGTPSGDSSPNGGGGGTTGTDSDYDPTDPDIHGNGSGSIDTAPVLEDEIDYSNDIKNKKNYLRELVTNQTISNRLTQLAPKIDTEYLEDGARFKYLSHNNYQIRLPFQRNGSSLDYQPDYVENEIVSVHIHQKEAYKYREDGTPSDDPFPNSPIYSDQDVLEFLENLNYIDTTNSDLTLDVTSLLMADNPNSNNTANLFALVVNNNRDKQDALNAYNALQDDDTLQEFTDDFNKKVLRDWEEGNCNDSCIINAFIDFINNYEINGEPLGISIYQYTNNNGIINWIKL